MNYLKELTCKCSFLPGLGGGNQEDLPTPESVKETSHIIAIEVCSRDPLGGQTAVRTELDAIHVRTMQRVVKELLKKHEIVFHKNAKSIFDVSQNGGPSIDDGLNRVFDETFNDEQINWGRVVAVYTFAYCLALLCVENGRLNLVENIASVTGNFVSNKLTDWIFNQGGWSSFEKQFQEEESVESKVWAGLLCTFFGLGALATVTALKSQ